MQGLELSTPPLLVTNDLPPANVLPLAPPTPPGPSPDFSEPEDTTGQARRRVATPGLGTHAGPRVLVSAAPVSAPGSSCTSIPVCHFGKCVDSVVLFVFRMYNRRWK